MKMIKKTLVFLLGFAMVLTLFAGTALAEEAQPDPSAAAPVSETETAAGTGTEGIGASGPLTEAEDAAGTAFEGTVPTETSEAVSEPQMKEETSADADTQKEEDAEAEFATDSIVISGAVSVNPTFAGTDDNDELLMDYIDVSLGTSTEAAYSTISVGKRLEGANLNAYTELKSWAKQVARGDITSTIIDLSKEELGLQEAYTKDNLGVSTLGTRGEVSDEAQAALGEVVPSLEKVNAALLFDNPYDLYWYDKSTNGAATYAYSVRYTYNTVTNEITSIEIPKITFRFAVAEEYADIDAGKMEVEAGGERYSNYYALDTTKLSTVQTALTTIQKIVDENASKGAYDKLKAYKDKIDDLVDYHETAMLDSSTPYGNPWQLIWVFDKDPATKVVCEGYSKAFQYLFDLSSGLGGIDCRIVTGPMDGGTGAGPHMWNIVTMADGNNYLVDVTNCDNGMIGYPDDLFLVGANYDSTANNYSRGIGSRTITYQYDEDTVKSYTSEELALSSTDYDPEDEPVTYTVTFVDEDGTVLKGATAYPEGTKAADITKPEDPTKAADAQYTYTFAGWTPEIADVTEDATYTATYNETVNQYTVTFVDEDGTVLATEQVAYGTKPSYTGTTPTKEPDAQHIYTFAGWSPAVTAVTGDATYTATYKDTTFDPPVPASYTGLKQATDGNWYYLKDGEFAPTYNGVVQNENGWWKVTNGKVDFSYIGFERNANGWWYLENGKVSFKKNGVLRGTANNDPSKEGEYGRWLVKGSRVQNINTVANSADGWLKITNGKVDETYTGVAQNENGWWKITNGKVDFGFKGFERNEFGWWYLEGGKVSFNKNGLIYGEANTNPSKEGEYGRWLVRGSRVQNINTVANGGDGWWYIKNGKVDDTYTGVAQNENGWWKITNGKVNFSFKGFERNEFGWWYLEGGKVSFGKNDVIEGIADTDPSKEGKKAWWLVRGSRVQKKTTVANNANGWWYVKDGKVDFSYTGVANNDNGWWKITNGKVDFGFKGFERNDFGWWYLEGGKVSFGKNDVIEGIANTDQSKEGEKAWWLVRGSRVEKKTTVANNANGWWYVKDGKVDFSYTGVANNENGWWKITNGKVDFTYKGFERNDFGWWYLEGGKVGFDKNDVIYGKADTDQSKEGEYAWWLVRGSRVEKKTTVAQNVRGWWYVKDGKVDFTYNGVAENENGMWKIENGAVNFGYSGFEKNESAWWYLEGGKVSLDKNSVIIGKAHTNPNEKGEDGLWLVRKGKIVDQTIVAQNEAGWWYVENGKVNFKYTGLGTNENGTWYIRNGKVDFSFNGEYDGIQIINGKAQV